MSDENSDFTSKIVIWCSKNIKYILIGAVIGISIPEKKLRRTIRMPKITFLPHEELCPEGLIIEVEEGVSICDIALQNKIDIEHACEKSCARTTCHVYIREGLETLEESTEDEDDMLDLRFTRF